MSTPDLIRALESIADRIRELRDDDGSGWVEDIDVALKSAERRVREAVVEIQVR